MAVALDAKTSGATGNNNATTGETYALTIAANATAVVVHRCEAIDTWTATYAGTSCTLIGQLGNNSVGFYAVVNPTTGTNNVVTTHGSARTAWGAKSYTGTATTNTTDLTGANAKNNGATGDPTVTLTTQSSTSLVDDDTYIDFSNNSTSTASGTGQTKDWGTDEGSQSNQCNVSSHTTSVAGSQTISYSHSGTNPDWSTSVVEIMPPVTATPKPITSDLIFFN